MEPQSFKELVEKSQDKFKVFEDKNAIMKYSNTVVEIIESIEEFLTDEEKIKIFDIEHFRKINPSKKFCMMNCVLEDKDIELLKNSSFLEDIKGYQVKNFIEETLNDFYKLKLIGKPEFLKGCKLNKYQISDIIKTLSEENKKDILFNSKLLKETLNFDNYAISELISTLQENEIKLKMIDLYEFGNYQKESILKTLSDDLKKSIIIDNEYGVGESTLESLCSSLSVDVLVDFLRENREVIKDNNIKTHKIVSMLDIQKQLEFMSKFENVGLNLTEKRQVLAKLREETKSNIDISNFPQEYVTAIQLDSGRIVDFDKDLNIYKGLDEIIHINPLKLSEKEKIKFIELCKICPGMNIEDNLGMGVSTVDEFIEAEKWVDSIINEINPEWSNIQKVAFIDNKIGKRISYTPEFKTEVWNLGDCRALWKIIDSGYGVCNGIAHVEKYILNKVGIEAEQISGKDHCFLKLNDIEIPTADGEIIKGNTILDPTWNLSAHRYGFKPNNFCRSYEKIRENDIAGDGSDLMCHKNDEKLSDATLDLDDQSMGEIFSSIGFVDEERKFPISELLDKSEMIDKSEIDVETNVGKQLKLIEEYCPEFAMCQNSTARALQMIFSDKQNIKFNRCVVNRVYEKEDKNKKPVLYMYMDLPGKGKKFYYADKNSREFVNMTQEEFETKFECYEADKEKAGGLRPWEEPEVKENVEDLVKMIATEGEER